jgi:hypothetical protein
VKVKISELGEFEGVRLPDAALIDQSVYVYSKSESTLHTQDVQVLNKNEDGYFVAGLKNNDIVITQEVLGVTDSSKYDVLVK